MLQNHEKSPGQFMYDIIYFVDTNAKPFKCKEMIILNFAVRLGATFSEKLIKNKNNHLKKKCFPQMCPYIYQRQTYSIWTCFLWNCPKLSYCDQTIEVSWVFVYNANCNQYKDKCVGGEQGDIDLCCGQAVQGSRR